MTTTSVRIDEAFGIFRRALSTDDAGRAELIRVIRGENPVLADEVASLLEHDRVDSWGLGMPGSMGRLFAVGGAGAEGAGASIDRAGMESELPAGEVVGGLYRIRGLLGDGGFSVVYEAEQDVPVSRRVALKVLRGGLGLRMSGRSLMRFEQERQVLAMLNHPGIAPVLDAGALPDGRPYFVMQLVEGGTAITAACDRERLSVSQRLELFVQLCEAVSHAHERGIIHRDLKPGNVLVRPLDEKISQSYRVVVIDFGISKTLEPLVAGAATMTGEHVIVGTPAYMSPEQASGDGDISVRTDVYSLGAMLFELLCGQPPVAENGTLRVLQKILDEDAPSLLDGLGRLGRDRLQSIALARGCTERVLTKRLRGELSWIVARALSHKPNDRYASVQELANDVRSYLGGRAVSVAPPSMRYRTRKWISRNKTKSALGLAAGLLVLGVSAGVFLWVAGKSYQQASLAYSGELISNFSDMALPLYHSGEPAKLAIAGEMYERASKALGRVEGESASVLIEPIWYAGQCYRKAGDLENALRMYVQVLPVARLHEGEGGIRPLTMMRDTAEILGEMGRLEEAKAKMEEFVAMIRAHPLDVGRMQRSLRSAADRFESWGNTARAIELRSDADRYAGPVQPD
jgi:serine/threonine protein kinase